MRKLDESRFRAVLLIMFGGFVLGIIGMLLFTAVVQIGLELSHDEITTLTLVVASVLCVAIAWGLMILVVRAKLTDTIKATFLTFPVELTYFALMMLLGNSLDSPVVSVIGIGTVLATGILWYFNKKNFRWQYFISVIYSIILMMGYFFLMIP